MKATSRAPRIASRILKYLFSLLIFTVCCILLWRVFFSTQIPDEIKHLDPNPALCRAYGEKGGELTLRYQEQSTITRSEKSYGYFSVERAVFIPEINQVQIIFRYINSTIRHLAEDYQLEEIPSKSEHLFDVTLVKTTDLTPDNKEDNIHAETLRHDRIQPNGDPVRETTLLYTYYRYTFDGVTVDELTDGVLIDVYYAEDINYDEAAYGTLCIYHYQSPWLKYPLTAADKKALGEQ
jgi:hypothetical protein